MCGLAGAYTKEVQISHHNVETVKKMVRHLSHRGPDHNSTLSEKNICLGLTFLK